VDVSANAQYPAQFVAAVGQVLADEGGLTLNLDDPGGVTKFGISAREYPTLDIAALTRDDAIAIYYRDWWLKFGFDRLEGGAAAKTFDLAVDIGPDHAIKCVQRALRACKRPVAEDGVIGDETAAATFAVPAFALAAALRSEAAGYYRTVAALSRSKRPNGDRQFLAGWLNRAYE
jgi:lysozyme family protein